MTDEIEIAKRIDILKQINTELDDYNKYMDILFTNENDYSKLMEQIEPKERIDLNWNLSFSTYTLNYLQLKLQNVDPNDHEIKLEMKRVQDYHTKINELENINNNVLMSNINKEAANRFIKNSLSGNTNINKGSSKLA